MEGKSKAIVSVCIDLAKNDFAAYGVDESGSFALVRPSVPRAWLLGFIDQQGQVPVQRTRQDFVEHPV
jgi:transposase